MAKLNPEETESLKEQMNEHLDAAASIAEQLLEGAELDSEEVEELDELLDLICEEEEEDEPEPAA